MNDRPPVLGPATDTNPRCDRCKCGPHAGRKCPNRWCGCLRYRLPAGVAA